MTDTLIARLRNGNLFADRVEAADRIEELQAIINQPVPLSEWQKMEAERDQLRAEVSKWMALTEGNVKLNEHLTARLTALEGQSPIWYYKLGKHGEHRFYDHTETQPEGCIPLFLAAGAAPTKGADMNHTIESVFILAQQYGVAAWLGVRHTETRDALLAALTEVFAQAAPTKEQT